MKEFTNAVIFEENDGAVIISQWEGNIHFYCNQNNIQKIDVNQLKRYFHEKYDTENLLLMRDCSSFIKITESLYSTIL